MSRLSVGTALVVVWVLLWGSPSVANILSGVAVAVALFLVYPTRLPMWPVRPVRPLATLRLIGHFALDVVVSNFWLSVAAFAPTARIRSATVWVDLQVDDPFLTTMVTSFVALTPGVIVVTVAHHHDGRPTLQVHTLATGDPVRFARSIPDLEVRCVRALGTRAQVAGLVAVDVDRSVRPGPVERGGTGLAGAPGGPEGEAP